MVSEAPHSLLLMSGRDDEWVALAGRSQGGEGAAVGAGWRHRHEAGGGLAVDGHRSSGKRSSMYGSAWRS